MENLAITQNLVNTQGLVNSLINEAFFLVKAELKTYSGERTEVMTVFKKQVSWESVCNGVRQGFIHQEDIESCDITIYVVKNNKYKVFATEPTFYYEKARKEYLQRLLRNAS